MANGLLKAHSYCILSAKEVSTGQKIFKMRNIWKNQNPWNGELSREEDFSVDLMEELEVDLREKDVIYVT